MLQYKKYVKFTPIILAAVFCVVIFLWQITAAGNGSGFLEVNFFDVGQGDAIFIEEPRGGQILIDGGPDSVILEKLGKTMNYFDRYIDVVIATHPDKDHINGLIDVLKYYKIGELWMTDFGKDTSFYKELVSVVEKKNIVVNIVSVGDYFEIGGMRIVILNPVEKFTLLDNININDTSIVAKISYDNVSFLFTGDITMKAERKIMEDEDSVFLDSDILKVAHHGSKSSSSEKFLAAVSPDIAVIQAGRNNPYDHPHSVVLDALENFGATILRTDTYGDITIVSDGKNYTIEF